MIAQVQPHRVRQSGSTVMPSSAGAASIKASSSSASVMPRSRSPASQARQPPRRVMSGAPRRRRPREETEAGAVFQLHRPEPERRRHLRQQRADRGGRQRPYFAFDRAAIRRAHHARAGCRAHTGDTPAASSPRAGSGRPSAVIWRFSGRPDMCAPMQNSAVSSGAKCIRLGAAAAAAPRWRRRVGERAVQRIGERGQPPSDQAGPSSVTPTGSPSAPKPAGTAIAGEVAEVDEIGEGAEPACSAPIGSACDLGQRRAERRRRQQQRIVVRGTGLPRRGGPRPGRWNASNASTRQPRQPAFQDVAGHRVAGCPADPPSRRAARRCVRRPRGRRRAGGRFPGTARCRPARVGKSPLRDR